VPNPKVKLLPALYGDNSPKATYQQQKNQAANISRGPGAEETEQPIAVVRVERTSARQLPRPSLGRSTPAPAVQPGSIFPCLRPAPALAAPRSVARPCCSTGQGGASPKTHLGRGMGLPPGRGEPHPGRAEPAEHSPARPVHPSLTRLAQSPNHKRQHRGRVWVGSGREEAGLV